MSHCATLLTSSAMKLRGALMAPGSKPCALARATAEVNGVEVGNFPDVGNVVVHVFNEESGDGSDENMKTTKKRPNKGGFGLAADGELFIFDASSPDVGGGSLGTFTCTGPSALELITLAAEKEEWSFVYLDQDLAVVEACGGGAEGLLIWTRES